MEHGLEALLPETYTVKEVTALNIELRKLKGKENEDDINAKVTELISSPEEKVQTIIFMFTDLEGRRHKLEYEASQFIDSMDNLTFDGSSIRGYSDLSQADLRLEADLSTFKLLPSEVFGHGKALVLGYINNPDGSHYAGDMRRKLANLADKYTVRLAPELETFLLKGRRAEQHVDTNPLDVDGDGSYFDDLPKGDLITYMDCLKGVLRSLAIPLEKCHPEVATGQLEVNYSHLPLLEAADTAFIFMETACAVADALGKTVSFLPKPYDHLNGSGAHTNISISKDGKNIFHDANDQDGLSEAAHQFAAGILKEVKGGSVLLNASVNAHRRLKPGFESPNQIKMGVLDRDSVIRIPAANEKSARIEVRSVAPDANFYLAWLFLAAAGIKGMEENATAPNEGEILPSTLQDAIECLRASKFIKKLIGEELVEKYIALKSESVNYIGEINPDRVTAEEVLHHHLVRNQDIDYLGDQRIKAREYEQSPRSEEPGGLEKELEKIEVAEHSIA